MVRGRRVRPIKNDDDLVSASPKRKDSRMENIGSLANGVAESVANAPATRSKNGIKSNKNDSPQNKNGFITNYFTVVSPENIRLMCDPIICQSDTNSISSELSSVEEKTEHFALSCFTGFETFNDIIHSSCNNNTKNTIINGLIEKDIKSEKCDSLNGDCKIEESCEDQVKQENASPCNDPFNISSLRLSPRKHASTLQRCVSTVKENVKTPHRIGLSEPFTSRIIGPLNLQPQMNRTRRRLNTALDEKPEIQENGEVKEEFKPPSKLPLTEIVGKEGALTVTKVANNKTAPKRSVKSKQNYSTKVNGAAIGDTSHKLTEYYPIRRSVRKTKKEVLEERQKDMEMAVREEREDGLEVTQFEGKGRGVVAARYFQRGDFVVEYAGELVSLTEAKIREAQYAHDRNMGCYMYYFRHNNQQYCIDATAESGRIGRLVNHSRNGNLITKTISIDSQPRLVLLANQDINAGEEITYDYGDRSKESLQHHPWLAL